MKKLFLIVVIGFCLSGCVVSSLSMQADSKALAITHKLYTIGTSPYAINATKDGAVINAPGIAQTINQELLLEILKRYFKSL